MHNLLLLALIKIILNNIQFVDHEICLLFHLNLMLFLYFLKFPHQFQLILFLLNDFVSQLHIRKVTFVILRLTSLDLQFRDLFILLIELPGEASILIAQIIYLTFQIIVITQYFHILRLVQRYPGRTTYKAIRFLRYAFTRIIEIRILIHHSGLLLIALFQNLQILKLLF